MKAKELIDHLPGLMEGAKPFRSFRTDKLTSKMWILPDGKVQSLDRMHYEWIFQNRKVALKYGLRVKSSAGEQSIRLSALRKGFARVNYERQGGVLTVEANKRWFKGAMKDAILALVRENAGEIDQICVHVLDDTGKLVQGKNAMLLSYDDLEKVNHIPLVTEPEGRRKL